MMIMMIVMVMMMVIIIMMADHVVALERRCCFHWVGDKRRAAPLIKYWRSAPAQPPPNFFRKGNISTPNNTQTQNTHTNTTSTI
jgi:hypothetical protein